MDILKTFEDKTDFQNFKTETTIGTRPSTKYDKNGILSLEINQMDYNPSTISGIYGLFIEEAHSNILTPNQSTSGDTLGDITGFTATGMATIQYQTDEKAQGNGCIAVTTGGISDSGIKITTTLETGNTYTFSPKVKIPAGKEVYIYIGGASPGRKKITGTGNWENVFRTYAPADVYLYLESANPDAAYTFYIDMLQLTKTNKPLSWTLGETSVSAETMVIPANNLKLHKGTIDIQFYYNPDMSGKEQKIFTHQDNGGNNKFLIYKDTNNKPVVLTSNNVGTTSSIVGNTAVSPGMNTITVAYTTQTLEMDLDGVSAGNNVANPNLPTTHDQYIYIGSGRNTEQSNTITRNLNMSNFYRTTTDRRKRSKECISNGYFKVDHKTSVFALFQTDGVLYKRIDNKK